MYVKFLVFLFYDGDLPPSKKYLASIRPDVDVGRLS